MTLPTFDSARDEIKGLFWAAWQAYTPLVDSNGVPVVRWEGKDEDKDYPPVDANWARVTIQHSESRNAAFGSEGKLRYERGGFVTIQIFASLSANKGIETAEKLAIIARNAFEGVGTASGIWFRRVRTREIGPEPGGWFQINVVADFEYDEVK